ncbi:DNRLRE domain-containing protein [Adhaeribacter soli]|uniref:DNRLRE domain-containing protein n=1 Tax=Adhaeribacter soli TaxID=2607655 RepID=A0A5N1IM79_9BACT|nr:DNRLRE domain-containing protein [Adhaeribacter soli]KAA9324911.1 DNRLRE domain-containing protein [Adhaeribacter soli]
MNSKRYALARKRLLILFIIAFSLIKVHLANAQSCFGDYEWAHEINSNDMSSGKDIAVDEDGNRYVLGNFVGSITIDGNTYTPQSGRSRPTNIYVAKFTEANELAWLWFGEGDDVTGTGIVLNGSEVAVTGYFANELEFAKEPIHPAGTYATSSLGSSGDYDIFIVSLNVDGGEYLWSEQYGDDGMDISEDIAVDQHSNIYVTGRYRGTALFSKILPDSQEEDIFIFCTDAGGSFQWANSATGPGNDSGMGVTVVEDQVFITGYFEEEVIFDNGNLALNGPRREVMIAAFDRDGNFVNAINPTGPSNDEGLAISGEGDDLYITGYFEDNIDFPDGSGGISLATVGSSKNVYVAKFSIEAFEFRWAKNPIDPTSGESVGYSIATKNNSVYFTGAFDNDFYFTDAHGASAKGGKDVFTVRMDNEGEIIWLRSGGSNGDDEGKGIAIGRRGNCYVTGNFMDRADFGPYFTQSLSGQTNAFIIKPCKDCPDPANLPNTNVTLQSPAEGVNLALVSNSSLNWSMNISSPSLSVTYYVDVIPQVVNASTGLTQPDWSNIISRTYPQATLVSGSHNKALSLFITQPATEVVYYWRVGYSIPNYGPTITWSELQTFRVGGDMLKEVPATYLNAGNLAATSHTNNINWVYEVTYGDNNKTKESITYTDGLGKVRQTQVRNNSENKILATETAYSEEGGEPVQSLVAPTGSSQFGYAHRFFDVNDGGVFGDFKTEHFDREVITNGSPALMTPKPIDNTFAGSVGHYYSNNSTEAYVDDAGGYPYAYSVNEASPLDRPWLSGGVGATHKITGGKETQTTTVAFSEDELARVFGKAKAEKLTDITKTINIDPNGVVSYVYSDDEGRTIATAMGGCSSVTLNQDLLQDEDGFGGTDYTFNILKNDVLNDGDLNKTSSATFYLSCGGTPGTPVNIHYEIEQGTFLDATNKCSTCEYDLEVKLVEDKTGEVKLNEILTFPTPPAPAPSTPPCSTATGTPFSFDRVVHLVNSGTYTIYRTLKPKVDPATGQTVVAQATQQGKTLAQLKTEFADQYYSRDEWYVLRKLKTSEGRRGATIPCNEILPKAQVTLESKFKKVSYQPGALQGKDTQLKSVSLVPGADPLCDIFADGINFGNDKTLEAAHQQVSSPFGHMNCGYTYQAKGILDFDLQNKIPNNAIIVSAKLSLYSAQSQVYPQYGGAEYGHAWSSPGSNAAYIKRIAAPWDEQTITWFSYHNPSPLTSPLNPVTIPGSSATDQHYENLDVTQLVKDMVTYNTFYGFAIELINQTSSPGSGNHMRFATSDFPIASLRPKLEIIYADNTNNCSVLNSSSLGYYGDAQISIVPPYQTPVVAPVSIGTITWYTGTSITDFVSEIVNEINAGSNFTAHNNGGTSNTIYLTAPAGTGDQYNNWQLKVDFTRNSQIGANCFEIKHTNVQPFTGGFDANFCEEYLWYADQVTQTPTGSGPGQVIISDLDGIVNANANPPVREGTYPATLQNPNSIPAGHQKRFDFINAYERMHWVNLKDTEITLMEDYPFPLGPKFDPLRDNKEVILGDQQDYRLIHVTYRVNCEDRCTPPKEFPTNTNNCNNTCEQQEKALIENVKYANNAITAYPAWTATNKPNFTNHGGYDIGAAASNPSATSSLRSLVDTYLMSSSSPLTLAQKKDLEAILEEGDPVASQLYFDYQKAVDARTNFTVANCVANCNSGAPTTSAVCETCASTFKNNRSEIMSEITSGYTYLMEKWESNNNGSSPFPFSNPLTDFSEQDKAELGATLYNYLVTQLTNQSTWASGQTFVDWQKTALQMNQFCNNCDAPDNNDYSCWPDTYVAGLYDDFPSKLIGLLSSTINKAGGIVEEFNDCLKQANDPVLYACEQNRKNCIAALPAGYSQQDYQACLTAYPCTSSTNANGPVDRPQRMALIRNAVSPLITDPQEATTEIDLVYQNNLNLTLAELSTYLQDYEAILACKLDCRREFELAFQQWLQSLQTTAATTVKDNFVKQCYQKNEKLTVNFVAPGTHHFTLYNYNAAGHLVSTVPPEGVDFVDPKNNPMAVPAHRMLTTYETNSLGQLLSTETPDGGKTLFAYDKAGRLIFSQNAEQRARGNTTGKVIFSFTLYEAESGNIRVTGEGVVNKQAITTQTNGVAAEFMRPDNNTANPGIYVSDWVEVNNVNWSMPETFTYFNYDQDEWGDQQNLGQRLSFVESNDMWGYYSYDKHGRVKSFREYNFALNDTKLTEYEFTPLTSQVQKVKFQKDNAYERFSQKYTYDADDRLSNVDVTRGDPALKNTTWDRAAEYKYYLHGPIKSKGLGENIQKLDYVYNINGWLKSINHPLTSSDPGQDGIAGSLYSRDVFGLTLNYFDGDYTRTNTGLTAGSTIMPGAGTKLAEKRRQLYNGNITGLISYTAFDQTTAAASVPSIMGQTFSYDVLNRLRSSFAETQVATTTGFGGWRTTGAYNPSLHDIYQENLSYDANGNIKTLKRTAFADAATQQVQVMDNMTYNYPGVVSVNNINRKTNNKLGHIDDDVVGLINGDLPGVDDVIDQSVNNYIYDAKGRLVQDLKNEIQKIEWTAFDKVKSITRTPGSSKAALSFTYDAMGKKISKTVTPVSGTPTTTYYHYGMGEDLMATTKKEGTTYTADEAFIYGAERVGSYENGNQLSGTPSGATGIVKSKLHFELTDHLSNVRAVVSGEKTPAGDATILSLTDYYPFGSPMPGRSFNPGQYKYGFNGIESEDNLYGEDNFYNTDNRMYDSRIGRWFSQDRVINADLSPYAGIENSPIAFKDSDGNDAELVILGNTATFKTQIFIYGPGATFAQANLIQNSIMKAWNNNWKYTDPETNKVYNVKFEVAVTVLPSTGIFEGLLASASDLSGINNYVQILDPQVDWNALRFRSKVIGGREGVWKPNDPWVFVHEFGHLIGLVDKYVEGGKRKDGIVVPDWVIGDWEGHVMASPDGRVSQETINLLMKYTLFKGSKERPFANRRAVISSKKVMAKDPEKAQKVKSKSPKKTNKVKSASSKQARVKGFGGKNKLQKVK